MGDTHIESIQSETLGRIYSSSLEVLDSEHCFVTIPVRMFEPIEGKPVVLFTEDGTAIKRLKTGSSQQLASYEFIAKDHKGEVVKDYLPQLVSPLNKDNEYEETSCFGDALSNIFEFLAKADNLTREERLAYTARIMREVLAMRQAICLAGKFNNEFGDINVQVNLDTLKCSQFDFVTAEDIGEDHYFKTPKAALARTIKNTISRWNAYYNTFPKEIYKLFRPFVESTKGYVYIGDHNVYERIRTLRKGLRDIEQSAGVADTSAFKLKYIIFKIERSLKRKVTPDEIEFIKSSIPDL